MDLIRAKGREYGLEFNEDKLEMMTINGEEKIAAADGTFIKQKDSLVYLGSVISKNGSMQSELSRRIGTANQAYYELVRLWSHASVPLTRKLEVFEACVVSRLLYSLQACWMSSAELSRIDAFYCKCLRRILRIPPSFVSRVPNSVIYARTGRSPLRYKLLQSQLGLFGHVARLSGEDALRQCLLTQNDVRPAIFNFRSRGGQKHTWINEVFKKAFQVAGDLVTLRRIILNKLEWTRLVGQFISGI